MVTQVRPQNVNLKVNSGTEIFPSFVGMLHLDSNNILRVDTVGAGVLTDFKTVLPQHTTTGEHGPKVTITQTAADNALAITKSGGTPAAQITITNNTGGKGLSIISASDSQQGLEVQQNGNADAVHIDVNGTGRALVTEDGDVLFDDGNVAIGNGEFRVNTDRLFVSSLRVGVGTTTPDRLLDVNGGAAFRGNHIYLTNPSALPGQKSWGLVVDTIDGHLSLGTALDILPAGGSLVESVVQIEHGAPSNTFYIDNTGQVGIGTTAPGAKLEIESAVNELALFVDKNGGASNAVQIDNSGLSDGLFVQNLVTTQKSAVNARSTGTGPVIQVHSSGTGKDIEGTNASWFVDRLGNATFNSINISNGQGIFTFSWSNSAIAQSTGALAFAPRVAFALFGGRNPANTADKASISIGFATGTGSSAKAVGAFENQGADTSDWSVTTDDDSIGGLSFSNAGLEPAFFRDIDVTQFSSAGVVLQPSNNITGTLYLLVLG